MAAATNPENPFTIATYNSHLRNATYVHYAPMKRTLCTGKAHSHRVTLVSNKENLCTLKVTRLTWNGSVHRVDGRHDKYGTGILCHGLRVVVR